MAEAIHAMNKYGGMTKCGQKVEGKLVSIWPAGVSPNALGAVLKPPLFYYAGPTRSARKEARGRFIGVWKLNHE